MMSGAGLPPRAISGYVILLQLEFIDVNGHSDVQSLGYHLWSFCYLMTMASLGSYSWVACRC